MPRCTGCGRADTGAPSAKPCAPPCTQVGTSLWLCTLTTGIGFFAFVPTNFAGLSELGVIAGGGMLIALIASLSVLAGPFGAAANASFVCP